MKSYIQKYYKFKKKRVTNVRIATPFNIICTFCNTIIPKGRKHNSYKEKCGEYLGIDIFRFYIRCIKCFSELSIKTDVENGSFICESGCKTDIVCENITKKDDENYDEDLESLKKSVSEYIKKDKIYRRKNL